MSQIFIDEVHNMEPSEDPQDGTDVPTEFDVEGHYALRLGNQGASGEVTRDNPKVVVVITYPDLRRVTFEMENAPTPWTIPVYGIPETEAGSPATLSVEWFDSSMNPLPPNGTYYLDVDDDHS